MLLRAQRGRLYQSAGASDDLDMFSDMPKENAAAPAQPPAPPVTEIDTEWGDFLGNQEAAKEAGANYYSCGVCVVGVCGGVGGGSHAARQLPLPRVSSHPARELLVQAMI